MILDNCFECISKKITNPGDESFRRKIRIGKPCLAHEVVPG
jgi:hypothetical protein